MTEETETPTPPPLSAIAVKGYMQNRQSLCEELATISSCYDREKDRRKAITEEIDKIDVCVSKILEAQNAKAQATPTRDTANAKNSELK
jgi:hypothetical protein